MVFRERLAQNCDLIRVVRCEYCSFAAPLDRRYAKEEPYLGCFGNSSVCDARVEASTYVSLR